MLTGVAVLAAACLAASAGDVVIKSVGTRVGTFMGKPSMFLTGTPVSGSLPVSLAIPNVSLGPKVRITKADPNPAIMSVIQDAKPGDYFRVSFLGAGAKAQVQSVSPYTLQPGEDEPNIYRYVDKGQEKVGDGFRKTVTVSRFGENFTMTVPMVAGAADTQIMQAVDGANAQTLLEIISIRSGKKYAIKTLKIYEPPKEYTFVKAVQAGKDITAIEVKDGDKTVKIDLDPKAENSAALLKKVHEFKAGQSVLVRSSASGDATVLLDIKAKEDKTNPTSKPGG
jgi:hypothetical protein